MLFVKVVVSVRAAGISMSSGERGRGGGSIQPSMTPRANSWSGMRVGRSPGGEGRVEKGGGGIYAVVEGGD